MGLIDGIIQETQTQARSAAHTTPIKERYTEESQDPNEPRVMMMTIPEAQPDNSKEIESYQKTLRKLNSLKKQVGKTMSIDKP